MSDDHVLLLFVRNRDEALRFHISEKDCARLEDALLQTVGETFDVFRFRSGAERLVMLNLAAVHAVRYASHQAAGSAGDRQDDNAFAFVDSCPEPVALTQQSAEALFNRSWEPMPDSRLELLEDECGNFLHLDLEELVCLATGHRRAERSFNVFPIRPNNCRPAH